MKRPVEELEKKLLYRFCNQELLVRALTHRSWLSEQSPALSLRHPEGRGLISLPENGDNEQLEFLGDSILGFVVSECLVLRHPTAREGQLSQWKAHLVSSTHLHRCSVGLGIGDYLLLGKGEEQNGGRERRTLLANALEALIAALYIDAGIEITRAFIEEHILSGLENSSDVESIALLNHKSVLQERAQALGLPAPRYSTVETNGPEHAKIFTVEAKIGDRLASRASGTSKKGASMQAAELLIEQLKFLEQRESRMRAAAKGTSERVSEAR